MSLRVLTDPGDTVVVESPCYFGLLHLLNWLKLRAIEVSTDPRDGISLDALEQLFAQKTGIKAAVLNPNVHNPLGSIMPDEKKRHIADLLGRRRFFSSSTICAVPRGHVSSHWVVRYRRRNSSQPSN